MGEESGLGRSATGSIAEPSVGRPPVIAALTGVRAVAALWVVAYHLREPMFAFLPASRVLDPALVHGYLGVDVFFVLSGFIISYNYAGLLAERLPGRRRAFLVARFARIYPVHLLTLLMTAGLVGYAAAFGATLDSASHYSVGTFLGNVLMLQGLPGVDAWNVPAWSVSCELTAYLVFPLLAGRLAHTDRRVALVVLVSVLTAQIIALVLLTGPRFDANAVDWVRLAGEFSAGCLLWVVWRGAIRPQRGWDVAAASAVAGVVVVLAVDAFESVRFVATIPMIALFVVSVAGATSVVRTVLASRLMRWGGRVSYSLYLVHLPVVLAMFIMLPPSEFASSPLPVRLIVFLAYPASAVGVAAVVHRFVEEPCRRRIQQRDHVDRHPRERRTTGGHASQVARSTGATT